MLLVASVVVYPSAKASLYDHLIALIWMFCLSTAPWLHHTPRRKTILSIWWQTVLCVARCPLISSTTLTTVKNRGLWIDLHNNCGQQLVVHANMNIKLLCDVFVVV